MLPSAANCLPTVYCLGGPKRWKLLGPNTANRLVTSYSAVAGRLWATTTTTPLPHPVPTLLSVTSISLDRLRSNWVSSKLCQLLIWSKLSTPGYRNWTLISPILGSKPWCHGGTNAKMWMACMEVWCVPSAFFLWCIHQSQNKVLGNSVTSIFFYMCFQILIYAHWFYAFLPLCPLTIYTTY
jgi:hypothetical protein